MTAERCLAAGDQKDGTGAAPRISIFQVPEVQPWGMGEAPERRVKAPGDSTRLGRNGLVRALLKIPCRSRQTQRARPGKPAR